VHGNGEGAWPDRKTDLGAIKKIVDLMLSDHTRKYAFFGQSMGLLFF
jgi:hypothetical protein